MADSGVDLQPEQVGERLQHSAGVCTSDGFGVAAIPSACHPWGETHRINP